ncbi:MAG: hypothetical protein ACRDXD_02770 [Acidimicrobiia bacterium]
MALVETALQASERVLINVPAEIPRGHLERPGVQDTVAVIMFATNERLLWAGYDGQSTYRPMPLGPDGRVRGVRYGRFRTFYGFPAQGRGGFGFLLLSSQDASSLEKGTQGALTSIDRFLSWAERTLGPGAGLALQPTISDHPTARYIQMFGFPMWTPFTDSLISLVNERNMPREQEQSIRQEGKDVRKKPIPPRVAEAPDESSMPSAQKRDELRLARDVPPDRYRRNWQSFLELDVDASIEDIVLEAPFIQYWTIGEGSHLDYEAGDRVELLHAEAPPSGIDRRSVGTVLRYQREGRIVEVKWGNGERSTLYLSRKDRIKPVFHEGAGEPG